MEKRNGKLSGESEKKRGIGMVVMTYVGLPTASKKQKVVPLAMKHIFKKIFSGPINRVFIKSDSIIPKGYQCPEGVDEYENKERKPNSKAQGEKRGFVEHVVILTHFAS
jgi:hypothetical protein